MDDESPVNDNDTPPPDAIAFSDLAVMIGIDGDILLQRLAKILNRRSVEQETP